MADLRTKDEIRASVRERYATAARSVGTAEVGCCGSSDPCGCGGEFADIKDREFGDRLYSEEERASIPDAAMLASFGCGNPAAIAELHDG